MTFDRHSPEEFRGNGRARRVAAGLIRFVDRLSFFFASLAVVAIFAIFLLMLLEVVTRTFVGFSLQISWEISSYLLACLIFLAAPYTLLTSGHIRVSLFLELLPSSWGSVLDFLGTLMGIAASLMLIRVFAELTLRSLAYHSISATPLEVPLVYPQAGLTIGAVIFFLQFLARLARMVLREPPDIAAPTV